MSKRKKRKKRRKRKKTGRKLWLPSHADILKVEELVGAGLTHDQIADYFGINRATLYRRKSELSDFCDAIKRGTMKMQIATGGKIFQLGQKGNLGALIWLEKTRFGKTDRVQVAGDANQPLRIREEIRHKLSKRDAQTIADIIDAARKQTQ
jgi:hypothetical protein